MCPPLVTHLSPTKLFVCALGSLRDLTLLSHLSLIYFLLLPSRLGTWGLHGATPCLPFVFHFSTSSGYCRLHDSHLFPTCLPMFLRRLCAPSTSRLVFRLSPNTLWETSGGQAGFKRERRRGYLADIGAVGSKCRTAWPRTPERSRAWPRDLTLTQLVSGALGLMVLHLSPTCLPLCSGSQHLFGVIYPPAVAMGPVACVHAWSDFSGVFMVAPHQFLTVF